MSKLELRAYQKEAVSALFDYFDRSEGNPLIVVPTAGGKSLIIASFIAEALEAFPDTRIIIATHVKELVSQNCAELLKWFPNLSFKAGTYSSGLRTKEGGKQVLFVGVQSVAKKAREVGHTDLLLVDEAHLVPDKGEGQYITFVDGLRRINPDLKIIGFTATPFRTSSGLLCGIKKMFSSIAYNVSVTRLIDEGWLAPLVSRSCSAEYDTSKLRTSRGDFVQKDLAAHLAASGDVTALAVKSCLDEVTDRKKWLFFCGGIKQAEQVTELLKSGGRKVELVTGSTPNKERDALVKAYKNGVFDTLVNVGVFTTGFNVPDIDFIALFRPTQSVSLYIQILGRGMRIAPGKKDCLVYDFGGNLKRHGAINEIEILDKLPAGKGAAPTKFCERCFHECFAGVRECPECGAKFPEPEKKVDEVAASGSFIARQRREWAAVTRVDLDLHFKLEKPPSLKVTYRSAGSVIASEYVCIHHPGRARNVALNWCRRHVLDEDLDVVGDGEELGVDAEELLMSLKNDGMRVPCSILVDLSEKYPEILKKNFANKRELDFRVISHGIAAPIYADWVEDHNVDAIPF